MADYHEDNASFMVYKDWEQLFESLENMEEAGELIMALFAFVRSILFAAANNISSALISLFSPLPVFILSSVLPSLSRTAHIA